MSRARVRSLVRREDVPWSKIAWATVLGLAMTATAYVLVDPDLGTPAPLFQEFTCLGGGDLVVQALNGYDQPNLTMPQSAVRAEATTPDGEPLPVFFVMYKREGGGRWKHDFDQVAQAGVHFFHVPVVTTETEIYIGAKDLAGQYCRGKSGVLRGEP